VETLYLFVVGPVSLLATDKTKWYQCLIAHNHAKQGHKKQQIVSDELFS